MPIMRNQPIKWLMFTISTVTFSILIYTYMYNYWWVLGRVERDRKKGWGGRTDDEGKKIHGGLLNEQGWSIRGNKMSKSLSLLRQNCQSICESKSTGCPRSRRFGFKTYGFLFLFLYMRNERTNRVWMHLCFMPSRFSHYKNFSSAK